MNFIVEHRIFHPKQIEPLYNKLPESARNAVSVATVNFEEFSVMPGLRAARRKMRSRLGAEIRARLRIYGVFEREQRFKLLSPPPAAGAALRGGDFEGSKSSPILPCESARPH